MSIGVHIDRKNSKASIASQITPILIALLILVSVFLTGCDGKPPAATEAPAVVEIPTQTIVDLPVIPTATSGVITYIPGQDWQQNCISNQWIIYPPKAVPVDSNNCYLQPLPGSISTKEGKLYILAQMEGLISSEEYGIFLPLPQSAKVRAIVDFETTENGSFWFGVFSQPTAHSDGYVIVAPPDKTKERAFAIRSMPAEADVDLTERYFSSTETYTLGFDLNNGSINAVIQDKPTRVSAFPYPQRWLFIGYRAKLDNPKNGTVDFEAFIKNLQIEPQK